MMKKKYKNEVGDEKNAPNLPNSPNFITNLLIMSNIIFFFSLNTSYKSWERLGRPPKKLGSWESWEGWDGKTTSWARLFHSFFSHFCQNFMH